MNILDIIDKKRLNKVLTKEEIEYVISNYVNGNIKDYQMSSLLMAITINGMNFEETFNLTNSMLNSGEIIDLNLTAVDKHSTGGVGDKTTLILAPLVAASGVNVAKMSGRGLGHTGGTIDKLESIENFNTSITLNQFKLQVEKIGIALVGQMGNLVPADKKIYALRDVTGTVDSIPLIASSIMSKKLASGSSKIVIDLKIGKGALMKTYDDAKLLGQTMVEIGKKFNKETICVLTDMNQPLGNTVGNSLEVIESIEALKGNMPNDLKELILTLGSLMVSLGKNISQKDAYNIVLENINNHKGYEKFKELIKYQNGNINNIELAQNIMEIKAEQEGYISKIDALKIGDLARSLGAGRLTKDDKIDFGVGIVLNKKVSDKVNIGDTLLKVYYNEKELEKDEVLKAYTITKEKVKKPQLIYEIIR